MNAEELKRIQQPLKQSYRDAPGEAVAQLSASGEIDLETLTCRVATPFSEANSVTSGLHPKAGGDGLVACSGDMLLQSLVACSGVTFAAVATAMGLEISRAKVSARGKMDFRGTLGIDRETPVGLTSVELSFDVQSGEPDESIAKLIELTERYCVVLQTLAQGVTVTGRRASA